VTVYLDRLLDERASLTGIITGLADKAATEERDLTESERSETARLQERCAEIDSMLTEHHAQVESARAFATLQSKLEEQRETKTLEKRRPAQLETTSPGQAFIESEQFRSYPGRGIGQTFPIENFLPLGLEERALITTANLAIQPYVMAPVEQRVATPFLDVINVVRVSSGSVSWVVVGPDPVAAVVAEGAAKPEATVTFTPASAALDTIAHWVQITRQALDDASYIRSLLEGKLRRGLFAKISADAVALLAASGAIQTATNADMSAAIRIAVGKVEDAGYSPNAVVLNPTDYAALDIANATAAQSGAVRTNTFWGLTPVPSASVAAGTTYVGDFRSGMTLFDRGVTDVFLTDSHSDFFIKNILVILAEARVKSVIDEPLAICKTAAA
jgi:HK97 family phage major capsid protein